MKYFIKPDLIVIILTCVQLVTVSYLVYLLFTINVPWLKVTFFLSSILLLAFFLKMPLNTIITKDSITVNQIIGKIEFKKSECKIKKIDALTIKGSIRLFASGGMGGYIGIFKNDKLGKYTMYAITTKNLYLITTETGKQYVINMPSTYKFN